MVVSLLGLYRRVVPLSTRRHVDRRHRVLVDLPPAWHPVEMDRVVRTRPNKRPSHEIAMQQSGEGDIVLGFYGLAERRQEVAEEQLIRAAVDEGFDAMRDQVTAEIVVVVKPARRLSPRERPGRRRPASCSPRGLGG